MADDPNTSPKSGALVTVIDRMLPLYFMKTHQHWVSRMDL
jgi:hypothetical protein